MTRRDAYELSIEVGSVAAIVIGLSNQIDDNCDRLNDEYMRNALYGISLHLDRIQEDLERM